MGGDAPSCLLQDIKLLVLIQVCSSVLISCVVTEKRQNSELQKPNCGAPGLCVHLILCNSEQVA